MKFGYFLSCEEFSPADLVEQARRAEQVGFEALWISDHYHPWSDTQGHSPFVWSVIGALSQVTELPVTTAVTCPIMRIHPAVLAQAAATSQVLLGGRFRFGVGTGEALNEHVLGDPWPPSHVRRAMLAEAVEVIRQLFTGGQVNHDGEFYTVANARLYTVPDRPPPIYVSAFGPRSARLAGEIGDGFCVVSPSHELIDGFRAAGGGDKPVQAGLKVCYGPDPAAARREAHRRWASEQLPGELAQVLPTTRHIEQAAGLVTEEMIGKAIPHGPDLQRYLAAVEEHREAGVDELYVGQIGPAQDAFFGFAERELLPALR
jgi:G6PDH family F420-dependent oxidoreductase